MTVVATGSNRGKPITLEERRAIIRLRRAGNSWDDIARALGRNSNYLRQYARIYCCVT